MAAKHHHFLPAGFTKTSFSVAGKAKGVKKQVFYQAGRAAVKNSKALLCKLIGNLGPVRVWLDTRFKSAARNHTNDFANHVACVTLRPDVKVDFHV